VVIEDLVNKLINYFVDLCLLRAAPQDLPASSVLFRLTLLTNVLVGTLVGVGSRMNPLQALGESLFEVLLLLLVLHAALRWQARLARFAQTATAILGSGTLTSLLALPLLNLGAEAGELAQLGGILLLVLVVWSAVVLGHILRHAFDLPFGQAVTLGVLYTLISYVVMGAVFPLT